MDKWHISKAQARKVIRDALKANGNAGSRLKNTDYNPRANNGLWRLKVWVKFPALVTRENDDNQTISFECGYKAVIDAIEALEFLQKEFGRDFKGGLITSAEDWHQYYQVLVRRGECVTINRL